MACLSVGPLSFDADLVIFDKDGTLIDFEYAWGRQTVAGVERLVASVQGDDSLRQDLYRTLGYNPETRCTAGTGPLATAPMAKLYTIAATVLYQHGLTWDHAEAYAKSSFKAVMAAIPLEELIRPVGDVKLLLSDLRAAKAQIAIITTDDRSETEETVAVLDIEDQIDFLACGDDSVPLKPAPDAILNACDHLGVEPIRTLVVGDTVTDMMMAKNAGVGCRAAVLTGAGSRDALVEHADVVLDSIAQIHVLCS